MSSGAIQDSPFAELGMEAQLRLNDHPHVMLFMIEDHITFECVPGGRVLDPDDDTLGFEEIIPHLAEEHRLEPIDGRLPMTYWTDNAWNAMGFICDCLRWHIAVIRDQKIDFQIVDNRIVLKGAGPAGG